MESHQRSADLQVPSDVQEILRDTVSVFLLHCVSRPRTEHISWTLNFQQPLANLFTVADNSSGSIAGRAFTEDIKVDVENSFYQDLVRRNREPHRSYVSFTGPDPVVAAETYYHQSEQRPARFFRLNNSRFAILAAHPDYDEGWFTNVDLSMIENIHEAETVVAIETRSYRWFCGCNAARITKVLLPIFAEDPDSLFQGASQITVNCPRCAAKYPISQDAMTAALLEMGPT